MFKKEYFVTLPDTDAAGILFFGNYLKLAHVIYEEFMEKIDYSLRYILDDAENLILIVHSEADYQKSLYLGDKFQISLHVSKIGNSSFELCYNFLDSQDKQVASAKTVHVVVSKEKLKPTRIPEKLKNQLVNFQKLN